MTTEKISATEKIRDFVATKEYQEFEAKELKKLNNQMKNSKSKDEIKKEIKADVS